jgi:23S rRNA-/tRNA-specific pseudouridylate synthase
VLADEDGLLAVDKPAGVVTIPDQGGAAASLLAAVARFARVPLASLHATSRLDREVSGVVLFARTPAAVARLRAARDGGTYSRRYVAIASGTPAEPRGRWAAPIGRGADPRHRAAFGRDAVAASSDFAVVACAQSWTLLALSPVTGRTHQLRVHAAHAGVPLVGDRVYGGPCRLTSPSGRVSAIDRIALHAARVRVPRSDGGVFEVIAEPPSDLTDLWRAVGGDDAAWGAALAE